MYAPVVHVCYMLGYDFEAVYPDAGMLLACWCAQADCLEIVKLHYQVQVLVVLLLC